MLRSRSMLEEESFILPSSNLTCTVTGKTAVLIGQRWAAAFAGHQPHQAGGESIPLRL